MHEWGRMAILNQQLLNVHREILIVQGPQSKEVMTPIGRIWRSISLIDLRSWTFDLIEHFLCNREIFGWQLIDEVLSELFQLVVRQFVNGFHDRGSEVDVLGITNSVEANGDDVTTPLASLLTGTVTANDAAAVHPEGDVIGRLKS